MECTHSNGAAVEWSKIKGVAVTPKIPDAYHIMVGNSPEALPLNYEQISDKQSVAHLPRTKDNAAADFDAWEALAWYLAYGATYWRESLILAIAPGVRTIAKKEAVKVASGKYLRRKIEENFAIGICAVLQELDRWQKKKKCPKSLDEIKDGEWVEDMDGDLYLWTPSNGMFGDAQKYLHRVAKNAIMGQDMSAEPLLLVDDLPDEPRCRHDDDEFSGHKIDRYADTKSIQAEHMISLLDVDDPIHMTMLRLKESGLSHESIAKIVGKGKRYVSKWLSHYLHQWEQDFNMKHGQPGRTKRQPI